MAQLAFLVELATVVLYPRLEVVSASHLASVQRQHSVPFANGNREYSSVRLRDSR